MDKERIRHFAKAAYTGWKWFIWGLRWLSILVFMMLLFVGVSLRLPWKILVCLAVIPVVGIFVPKKIQPWVWMTLTLTIAAVWVWVKLPESHSGNWHIYQFNDELEKLQADWQIDPTVNAATGYERLLDTYGESVFDYPVIHESADSITFNRRWNREEFPQLAEWMETYNPAIEQLLEIVQIPECRFPIPHNFAATHAQLGRINRMKGWARLLLRSANLDLAEARPQKALEKQHAVLKMAQHLYQQKNLFDQAAAFHVELLAARALQTFIIEQNSDPETLDTIEQSFSELDPGWAKNWAAIIEREKLIAKNIAGLFYEIDDEGNTRIAHRAMFALQEGLGYAPRRLFFRQHEMSRLAVIWLGLGLPSTPRSAATLIDKRFDHYSLLSQKGVSLPDIPVQYFWKRGLNVQSAVDWLVIERVKYFWALHGQNSRHGAVVNLMRIFSALKKYHLQNGCWPEDLKSLDIQNIDVILTDAVNGKPFVYQKTGDNFRLYGLGPNGLDDNGENNPLKNRDDIVFWPRGMAEESFDGDLRIEKTSN